VTDDSRYRHPALVRILAVVIVVMLLAGGWLAIERGSQGYYAFAPGTAPRITNNPQCRANGADELVLPDGKACAHISAPPAHSHPLSGSLYMVDVLVGPATPGQYILSKTGLLHTFDRGTQLVPTDEVLGSTPAGQLPCQDAQQMQQATSTATVVAMRQLGYQVIEHDLGAQLTEVAPGTPAAAAGLQCNDVVVAVNHAVVRTAEQLTAAVHAAKPGDKLLFTVQRVGKGGKSQTETLPATLGTVPVPAGQPPSKKPFLGVVSMTRMTFSLPFNVTINVGQIGGPSAGLALTLGLIDLLSSGQLTGGHQIAATGTINLDGTVGDVGGVAQKAVAVRKAGAQAFLVPPDEVKDARSQAGSMKVFPVSTLQQALNDIHALGGDVPTAPVSQTSSG